jgi:hypothetical protein
MCKFFLWVFGGEGLGLGCYYVSGSAKRKVPRNSERGLLT